MHFLTSTFFPSPRVYPGAILRTCQTEIVGVYLFASVEMSFCAWPDPRRQQRFMLERANNFFFCFPLVVWQQMRDFSRIPRAVPLVRKSNSNQGRVLCFLLSMFHQPSQGVRRLSFHNIPSDGSCLRQRISVLQNLTHRLNWLCFLDLKGCSLVPVVREHGGSDDTRHPVAR